MSLGSAPAGLQPLVCIGTLVRAKAPDVLPCQSLGSPRRFRTKQIQKPRTPSTGLVLNLSTEPALVCSRSRSHTRTAVPFCPSPPARFVRTEPPRWAISFRFTLRRRLTLRLAGEKRKTRLPASATAVTHAHPQYRSIPELGACASDDHNRDEAVKLAYRLRCRIPLRVFDPR